MGGGSVSAEVIYILSRKRLRAAVEVVRPLMNCCFERGGSSSLPASGQCLPPAFLVAPNIRFMASR